MPWFRTVDNSRLVEWEKLDNLPADTNADLALKVEEAPIDGDVYWRVNAWWAVIPWGWDMLQSVYDPTNINADAFDQDNMVNWTTNKNYTDVEKTKLSGITTGAEINTGSNVWSGGIGIFKQKTLSNLEFKNINAGSSKVTIVNDWPNSEIDIDIVEANITLTKSQVGLGNVDNTSDTTKDAAVSVLTNKTITSTTNVLGWVTMTVGSDATWDTYYRNGSGILTRTPIWTTWDILNVSDWIPAWFTLWHFVIEDQKTSWTNGWAWTNGIWNTRILNTVVFNTISWSSLSANQFLLQAWTYYIESVTIGWNVDWFQSRIQNITDGTTALLWTSWRNAINNQNEQTVCFWYKTITSPKTFELQMNYQTANAIAYGTNAWRGVNEVYSRIIIDKLSA